MNEPKSVYVVVEDDQVDRVLSAMADVTSLIDSLRLGCEIAYRREPTQDEGDAHEFRHDQSMGPSYSAGECFVPMGGHHGWKCKCGRWVFGGPTVCQRCVDADAVKIALEWKAEADRLRKLFDDAAAIAALAMRVANHGGSLVCTSSLTPEQIAIARSADRMVVISDGTGFVYVPGPKVPTP